MSAIIDFFVHIYEFIVSLLSECLKWVIELFSGLFESLLSNLDSLIPDLSSYWSSFSDVQPYLQFVNKWVAVDVAITLFTAYIAFITTMITIKLVVKLFIPTVG